MTSASPLYILDFDATITQNDTISALFQSAVTLHARRNEAQGRAMREKLDWILNSYARDWAAFHASSSVKSKHFKSVDELIAYQRSLVAVERASFNRVSESRILGGFSQDEWSGVAADAVRRGDVLVRAGFLGFVEEVRRRGGKWGVVSVNFCKSWVRGVLKEAGIQFDEDDVVILANEPDAGGVLHGLLGKDGQRGAPVCTSEGKLEAMRVLLEKLGVSRLNEAPRGNVVFIGDSGTDVECLLDMAVTGIVMVKSTGESKLTDTLEAIGEVEMGKYGGLRRIKNVQEYTQSVDDVQRLWFAKDFREFLSSPLFVIEEKKPESTDEPTTDD